MQLTFVKSDLMFKIYFQSNSVPNHVKITVSRNNLFEDSFQEVSPDEKFRFCSRIVFICVLRGKNE